MFQSANGDRSGIQNYLVIMTDGMSDNTTQTWQEAVAARNAGIRIIAVSFFYHFSVNHKASNNKHQMSHDTYILIKLHARNWIVSHKLKTINLTACRKKCFEFVKNEVI